MTLLRRPACQSQCINLQNSARNLMLCATALGTGLRLTCPNLLPTLALTEIQTNLFNHAQVMLLGQLPSGEPQW